MARASAERDEVLAWMRETGRGAKAAAKQFPHVPLGTLKRWVQERDRGLGGDRSPTQGSGSGKSRHHKRGKDGGAGGTEPPRPSRATNPSPPRTAANLDGATRSKLRIAVDQLLDTLADVDASPKDKAHAARALDVLMGRYPDLMTFDERITSVDGRGSAGGSADPARVLAAMGLAPTGTGEG